MKFSKTPKDRLLIVSSIAYLVCSIEAAKEDNLLSILFAFVFVLSVLHHQFPDKKAMGNLDTAISVLAFSYIIYFYLDIFKTDLILTVWTLLSILIWLLARLAVNRKRQIEYIYLHALWHIVSASALLYLWYLKY